MKNKFLRKVMSMTLAMSVMASQFVCSPIALATDEGISEAYDVSVTEVLEVEEEEAEAVEVEVAEVEAVEAETVVVEEAEEVEIEIIEVEVAPALPALQLDSSDVAMMALETASEETMPSATVSLVVETADNLTDTTVVQVVLEAAENVKGIYFDVEFDVDADNVVITDENGFTWTTIWDTYTNIIYDAGGTDRIDTDEPIVMTTITISSETGAEVSVSNMEVTTTANKADVTVLVDSVSSVDAFTLADAKDAAKDSLANYVDRDDYREAQQDLLDGYLETAYDTIDDASSVDAVASIQSATEALIDKLPTDAELTAEEVAAAKLAAIDALNGYADPDDYRADEQVELAQAVADGLDDIADATTVAGVEEALADAQAEIDAIPTNKELTKEELNDYVDPADYREEQQEELADAIADGEAAIDAATTADEIAEALADAQAVIDAIPTDAELTAEEVAAAKAQATDDLNGYADPDDYRGEEQVELDEAVKAGLEAIDAATTVAEVEEALADAKAEIDAIPTNKELTKEELNNYADPADYREEQQEELAEAIADGEAAIDAATTADEIAQALQDAKDAIDAIKTADDMTADELQDAKDAAKDALDGYVDADDYRADEQDDLADAITDGKSDIDDATDLAEVEAALDAAKDVIDEIPTDDELTLQEAKDAAKDELDTYVDPDDYRAEEQQDLADAITDGKDDIDNATTLEEVEDALQDAKDVIDEIPTDDELTLQEAKDAAKDDLDTYVDPDDYREEEQQDLEDAITDGKDDIDNATTPEEVEEALQDAKDAIDDIKTDDELTAEELEKAKEEKKKEIEDLRDEYDEEDYEEDDWNDLNDLFDDAIDDVDNMDDEDDVDDVDLDALKDEADEIPTIEDHMLSLYDMNEDGVIDIRDITCVAEYFGHFVMTEEDDDATDVDATEGDVTDDGETEDDAMGGDAPARYDVSNNGTIDSADYLLIYQNMTE